MWRDCCNQQEKTSCKPSADVTPDIRKLAWRFAVEISYNQLMTSLFTKIINGEIPGVFVYEDDTVVAFMDIFPFNPGHVLVVPRQEVPTVDLLNEDVAAQMFKVTRKLCAAIRKSDIPADALRIQINDGPAAGQEVFHVHLHIQPRLDSERGRRKPAPEMATPEALQAVADKIIAALEE